MLPIVVPLQVPLVIVPKVVKLELIMLEAKVVPVSVPALTAAGAEVVQKIPFEVKMLPAAPGLDKPVPPLPVPIPTPCHVGPLPSFLIATVPAALISPFTFI